MYVDLTHIQCEIRCYENIGPSLVPRSFNSLGMRLHWSSASTAKFRSKFKGTRQCTLHVIIVTDRIDINKALKLTVRSSIIYADRERKVVHWIMSGVRVLCTVALIIVLFLSQGEAATSK